MALGFRQTRCSELSTPSGLGSRHSSLSFEIDLMYPDSSMSREPTFSTAGSDIWSSARMDDRRTMRCTELPPRVAVQMGQFIERWIRCQRSFPAAVGDLGRWAAGCRGISMTSHFNAKTRRAQRFAEKDRRRVLGSAFLGVLGVSALSCARSHVGRAGAPNKAAAGKGAIAFRFQVGRPGRALPEQRCWLLKTHAKAKMNLCEHSLGLCSAQCERAVR